jgi:Flp pilus assembly protein TadG
MRRDGSVTVKSRRASKRVRGLSARRGAAVVEFVVFLPVLLIFVLAAVDLQRAIDRRALLDAAVRGGARAGLISTATDSAIRAAAWGAAGAGTLPVTITRSAGQVVVAADDTIAPVLPFGKLLWSSGRIALHATATTRTYVP